MAFESEQKFSSTKEEIAWLEQKLQEKKAEALKTGETKEQEKIVSETIKEHISRPVEKVLAPEYKIPEKEIGARVLELKPETHDKKIEELLGILEEKGIMNAVSVSRGLGPHIEDDFHRVLVQYLLGRIEEEKPGFSESKAKLFSSLKMALFEISLPQEEIKNEQGKTFKDFISAMEQFYSGMASLSEKKGFSIWSKSNSHFALEISVPAVGEEISFYVSVPRSKSRLLEKHLLAVFPRAQIQEKKDDYNIFNFGGVNAAATAELSKSAVLPIRIYEKLSVDPLEVISNAFSKLKKEGEGAAMQIVISPSGDKFLQKVQNILSSVRKGESLKKAIEGAEIGFGRDMFDALSTLVTGGPKKKPQEENQSKPINEELINLLNIKSSRQVMRANIRLVVSAKTKEETTILLNELKGAFSQFSEPNGNSFVFKDLEGKNLEKFLYNFSFRIFDEDKSFYLNTAELTSVFHFPIAPISTPKVKYLKAKDAPPPQNIPSSGTLLGINVYRDETTNIYMNPDDRRRHLYVIGQTGTGKSVLMQNLIIQDIKNGNGVCMIDPHGDAVKEVLSHVPQERINDVIYFDPSDTARPMGLNMLDYDPNFPEQKTFIVNELLEIFNKLYNMSLAGGPMFEQYFRNATILVMDDPESGNTLLEIGRVLSDKDFREFKLKKCKNPIIKAFWKEVAEKAGGEYALANMVPYITSKFDTFLTNEIMRPIVSQSRSAFNFRQVMDEKKILLINLSKGRLGDLNSNLLGLIIVGKLLMAALSRVDLPENERKDFYLYIDEFQNVTTKSIATILSEARKYRLDLVIAHQFIGQLDEDIKKAVFGNVGSMAIFRVGADDTELLTKQVEPVFNANDLMNIDNYNAYLKLLIDGQTSRPFNIRTLPLGEGNKELAEQAKTQSSLKYGTPKEIIEDQIQKRYENNVPEILK